jgi:hypothetical protein
MKNLIILAAILSITSLSAQRRSYGHGGYSRPYASYGYHGPVFYHHCEPPIFRPYYNPFYRPVLAIPFAPRPIISLSYNAYRPAPVYASNENVYNGAPANAATTTTTVVNPMEANEFERARGSIYSKASEYGKLTVAEQVANANNLSAAQVKDIMGLFSAEESRLEFAKFAYNHTVDRNNYYIVNDAFKAEASISDLDNYLNGK